MTTIAFLVSGSLKHFWNIALDIVIIIVIMTHRGDWIMHNFLHARCLTILPLWSPLCFLVCNPPPPPSHFIFWMFKFWMGLKPQPSSVHALIRGYMWNESDVFGLVFIRTKNAFLLLNSRGREGGSMLLCFKMMLLMAFCFFFVVKIKSAVLPWCPPVCFNRALKALCHSTVGLSPSQRTMTLHHLMHSSDQPHSLPMYMRKGSHLVFVTIVTAVILDE